MQEIEDLSQLRCAVAQAYSAAAHRPQDQHPFPVGRGFAASLGYPQELLNSLPPVSVDAFAGVSSVSVLAELPPGSRVLDLGCGAGLDSLIAARRVGALGRVTGVDFSQAMLQRARQGVTQAGLSNIEVCQADAAGLPLADASVDVALINGIFNLNPQRTAIFQELARVLRPGGWVYAAEIILRGPLPPEVKQDRANWFA
jgi:arsenite methyltransferase